MDKTPAKIEKIPEEVLLAAELRFCRRVAAALVTALAESGLTYAELERKAHHKSGWAKRLLLGLMDGSLGNKPLIDDLADFALACGGELVFDAKPFEPVFEPLPALTPQGEQ